MLTAFFTFLGAALLSRLVVLQIKRRDFYRALGKGEQSVIEPRKGERGEVYAEDGTPLAVNRTAKFLFISPREIKEKEEATRKLAEITGLKKEEVLAKTKKRNYFEVLKRDISDQEERKIKNLDRPGVYIQKEEKRFYPQKETAAHVTGFLGGEGKGQYGLEGFYNSLLYGKKVVVRKVKSPFGFLEKKSPEASGTDIYTSLDPAVQYAAYEALSENKKELGFRSGQVVVMDPNNGAVKALAQVPSFDPNKYFQAADFSRFQNKSTQSLYEPGSVFKPLTMAGAINEDRVKPDTTYNDKGVLEIGEYTIHNYDNRVWGEQTMTAVLEKSINTGAVFAERKLGHHLFLDYLEKFGLFEKTGIDLQGEVFSENKDFKKGYKINFATASFGQGISVTPVQLLRAFTAIANKGKMVTPHLLERCKPSREKRKWARERVISKETAAELTNMLVSVVENGYAKKAQVEGYRVAGKTGTAQIPWSVLGRNKEGYSGQTSQTFIGFAPAFEPQFIILVKLDNPETKTAEYSAVPLFQKLAKEIINLWEIPPQKHETSFLESNL